MAEKRSKPYLIGIGGGSASGKTSFLRALVAQLPAFSCSVVSQDNYYHPPQLQALDANGQPNFDLPGAIDRQRFHDDLCRLRRGEPIAATEYTFAKIGDAARRFIVTPADVLVVEGLFLFHHEEVRASLDLRVFLEAEEAICRRRRIERDQRERGYLPEEAVYQWENHVLPAYRQYVLPYREQAHVIVANHTDYEVGLATVTQKVMSVLASFSPAS